MNNNIFNILMKESIPSLKLNELKRNKQLIPELEAIIGVVQSPIHHPEGDVWNHTMLVVDQAAKIKDETSNPFGFMLTALFHDLGKAETTTIEKDGRIRSIGHERCLDTVKRALKKYDIDLETTNYVLNMTSLHMRPNALLAQKSKQKAFNKVFALSINPSDLILFSKADHLGRINVEGYEENEKQLFERLNSYHKET